ncbi:hypothetical protein K469DRAFT_695991 [Zopfia rhizophila CBS 207.26]|uniref:Uncharacterized protein n=1 Tax=Zopfia rhizophila CBS 207.26 TaxID=1314779 RepID=A0A6A6EP78_9PEZI|nr:hypothetical protein K469DRAFT_695991 [Zopfia rhizophila CBS 207.26]
MTIFASDGVPEKFNILLYPNNFAMSVALTSKVEPSASVWRLSTSSNCSCLRLKVAYISCLFAWAPVSTCSGTVPRPCLFEAFVAQLLLLQSDGSSRPSAATEDPTHFESCSQSSSNKSNTGSDSSPCGRVLELVFFARRLEDLLHPKNTIVDLTLAQKSSSTSDSKDFTPIKKRRLSLPELGPDYKRAFGKVPQRDEPGTASIQVRPTEGHIDKRPIHDTVGDALFRERVLTQLEQKIKQGSPKT